MKITKRWKLAVALLAITAIAMTSLASARNWTRTKKYYDSSFNPDKEFSQLYANVNLNVNYQGTRATFVGETSNAWCGATPYVAEELILTNTYKVNAQSSASFSIGVTSIGSGAGFSVYSTSETNTLTNNWWNQLSFDHEANGSSILSASMSVYGRTKVKGRTFSASMGS
ncbi:MAG: hypothetical protein K6B39_07190 [Lachnospiraceae bacterium]|nr:hypothetical protein [Lachnospiraceae bacterium]